MPVNESDVRHFLGRVGFVPSDDEVAVFVGLEVNEIVNMVLAPNPTLPGKPNWINGDEHWLANAKTTDWWLNRMRTSRWNNRAISTPSPLVEKMAMFWHGHFATAFDKVGDAGLMFEQNQIIRAHALGDFEELAQRISRHGAMLIYLDNETNVKGAVQENFARELMELFTMGIGNYTETDVVSMARAWTGHGTVGWLQAEQRYDGTYEWHPDEHDNGTKALFGLSRNWNGPAAITEICQGVRQQATARFITTKLWRYFVHSAPPADAVNNLANIFIANDMSIKELMRALLKQAAFWAPSTRGSLVKSPTQFVVDFNRRTGLPFIDENMRWFMAPMGQVPFDPPNVAGWGTNGYWLSTATMWGRSQYMTGHRWSLERTGFLSEIEGMTAEAGVNRLFSTFGMPNVSQTTKEAAKAWFRTTQANDPWALVPTGIGVATLSPEFQVY